jgi:hypothetical protein
MHWSGRSASRGAEAGQPDLFVAQKTYYCAPGGALHPLITSVLQYRPWQYLWSSSYVAGIPAALSKKGK